MEIDPEWIRVNSLGEQVGKSFAGTMVELERHLSTGVEDVAQFTYAHDQPVYLRDLLAEVSCTVVTMTTPWGSYRWICRSWHPVVRPRWWEAWVAPPVG